MSFKKKLKKYSILLLGFSSFPMLTACYGPAYDFDDPYLDFEENYGQVEDEMDESEESEESTGASTEKNEQ